MAADRRATTRHATNSTAASQSLSDAASGRRVQDAGVTPPIKVPQSQPDLLAMELLLKLEEQAREVADLESLQHFVVNQTRKINRARQIFLCVLPRSGKPRITAVSGVSSLDPTSMLIADVTRMLETVASKPGLVASLDFTLPAFCEPNSDLVTSYPFREVAWVPFLTRSGRPFAGVVMTRELPWGTADLAISKRLCNAYAHAWRELQPMSRQDKSGVKSSYLPLALALAAGIALVWPMPMSALAPVEIVATGAMIVASPIDGVVETIDVDPNTQVKAGDVLVRFTDTQLRNRRDIAAREVAVAQARVRQANLLAFSDPRGRHELAIAESELELKRAELDYAADMLEKSVIRAPRDGIAIYADRKSLVGKPVATGERLIEIADPLRVEARIDVAVADVIALKQDGAATVFLDVDPLRPLSGRISRADYKSRVSDGDILTFRAFAQLNLDGKVPPRIGLRGTAQIRGDTAPAFLVLLRRPISAARQWLGL